MIYSIKKTNSFENKSLLGILAYRMNAKDAGNSNRPVLACLKVEKQQLDGENLAVWICTDSHRMGIAKFTESRLADCEKLPEGVYMVKSISKTEVILEDTDEYTFPSWKDVIPSKAQGIGIKTEYAEKNKDTGEARYKEGLDIGMGEAELEKAMYQINRLGILVRLSLLESVCKNNPDAYSAYCNSEKSLMVFESLKKARENDNDGSNDKIPPAVTVLLMGYQHSFVTYDCQNTAKSETAVIAEQTLEATDAKPETAGLAECSLCRGNFAENETYMLYSQRLCGECRAKLGQAEAKPEAETATSPELEKEQKNVSDAPEQSKADKIVPPNLENESGLPKSSSPRKIAIARRLEQMKPSNAKVADDIAKRKILVKAKNKRNTVKSLLLAQAKKELAKDIKKNKRRKLCVIASAVGYPPAYVNKYLAIYEPKILKAWKRLKIAA